MTKSEAQTRKEIIDKQLKTAGWNVDDCTRIVKEFTIRIDLAKSVKELRIQYDGHQFSPTEIDEILQLTEKLAA